MQGVLNLRGKMPPEDVWQSIINPNQQKQQQESTIVYNHMDAHSEASAIIDNSHL